MLRAVPCNQKLSCPVLSCSLTETGEWCEMGCTTPEIGFKNWSYFVLLKILFDIKFPLWKNSDRNKWFTRAVGLLKMCIYSLCTSSCFNSRRQGVLLYLLVWEMSWLLVEYCMKLAIWFFSLRHLFTPWSDTLKENHKVFVHLFLWSSYLDINWH